MINISRIHKKLRVELRKLEVRTIYTFTAVFSIPAKGGIPKIIFHIPRNPSDENV
jgi:hypothetical protein